MLFSVVEAPSRAIGDAKWVYGLHDHLFKRNKHRMQKNVADKSPRCLCLPLHSDNCSMTPLSVSLSCPLHTLFFHLLRKLFRKEGGIDELFKIPSPINSLEALDLRSSALPWTRDYPDYFILLCCCRSKVRGKITSPN